MTKIKTEIKTEKGKKAQLRRLREITCMTPSGVEVTIRPPNIEIHALSGGLPARLKELATQGIKGIDQAIQVADEGDPEMRTYLDGIVARSFVDPVFEPPVWEIVEAPEDEGGLKAERFMRLMSGDDLDDYLLPADYKWALLVAFGEEDEDGEGRRLWGREPLSRFRGFREEHGCPPDCEGCRRTVDRFSVGRAD